MKKYSIGIIIAFILVNNTYAGGYYNPNTAVQYARQYALHPNSTYPEFSSDCTNFLSQSLRAGGLTDDKWAYVPLGPLTGPGSTIQSPSVLVP